MSLSFAESLRISGDQQNTVRMFSNDEIVRETTEWVLDCDNYLYYEEYHDDSLSIVNEDKNIALSTEQINIAQESNSQYIPFEMNRYYDGFDLSKTRILFYFVNKNGYEDYSTPINVYYSDEKIRFAWLVDKRVTTVDGRVDFEIHAIGVNSKGDEYVWKTRPSDGINILKSLSGNGLIVPDNSWLESFVAQITAQTTAALDNRINSALSLYYTAEQVDELISSGTGGSISIKEEDVLEILTEFGLVDPIVDNDNNVYMNSAGQILVK